MSKRKASSDLYDRSIKLQKKLMMVYKGVKRKSDWMYIEQSYKCSIHDDDKSICLIYDCSGGKLIDAKSLYNYIN